MQKQNYTAYAAATQTVARTKQIVMLYDGVIRFMQQAKEAVLNKRIEDRYNALTRSSKVIMGLQGCLDFENGGHSAKVLYSFYSTIDGHIFSIHRTNSIETCNEVIDALKKMRDVWNEIDANNTSAGTVTLIPPIDTPASGGNERNITNPATLSRDTPFHPVFA